MASIVSGEKKHKMDASSIFNSTMMRKTKSPVGSLPFIQKTVQKPIMIEPKHNSSLNIANRKAEYNRIQLENQVSY